MDFLIPKMIDVIEIAFYSTILYRILLIFRKNGGFPVLISVMIATTLYLMASIFDLSLTSSILNGLKTNWIVILVILFQNEIKTALSRFGQGDYYLPFLREEKEVAFHPVLAAATALSFRKTGALIVFENRRSLSEYVKSGEVLDAAISTKLLLSIFQKNSILHDGAVIIKNNKIHAAKVYLPLSNNLSYSQRYGTRHMAAIGITESSDAFVVVISEETGDISFVQNGDLFAKLSIDELAQRLTDAIKG